MAAAFGLAACGGGSGDRAAEGESSGPAAPGGIAEDAFYRELIAEHGRDYSACISPIELRLKELEPPDSGSGAGAGKQLNVVIALDSSGSMAGQVKGGTKMELARRAIANFVADLPPEANVALIVYGHRGSNREADKAASCNGTETVYPLEKLDRARFGSIVDGLRPAGFTPLARAVKQSGDTLAPFAEDGFHNIVYIVSDGIETCGGDPVDEARSLHASSTRAVVNIIGFDVDNEAQRQLRAAAEAGGGTFYEARDDAGLTEAFRDASAETRRRVENMIINTQNRNEVSKVMIEAGNNMHACMTRSINQETADIQKAIASIPGDDPRFAMRNGVRQRYFDERRKNLTEWRDRMQKEINGLRLAEVQKLLDQRDEMAGTPR